MWLYISRHVLESAMSMAWSLLLQETQYGKYIANIKRAQELWHVSTDYVTCCERLSRYGIPRRSVSLASGWGGGYRLARHAEHTLRRRMTDGYFVIIGTGKWICRIIWASPTPTKVRIPNEKKCELRSGKMCSAGLMYILGLAKIANVTYVRSEIAYVNFYYVSERERDHFMSLSSQGTDFRQDLHKLQCGTLTFTRKLEYFRLIYFCRAYASWRFNEPSVFQWRPDGYKYSFC